MAYSKLNWENDVPPALNDTNLNHMDNGINEANAITFYSEVTYYKERTHSTDCYFAEIPVFDDDGDIINFYVDYKADMNPLQQADAFGTTITANGNATLDVDDPQGIYRAGFTISNGVVINSRSFAGYSNPNPMYIGIKADRSHVDYQMNSNITTTQMLADGCMNVFNCYFKLVENGAVTDLTNRYWNDYVLTENDEDVLMLLGFKSDNTIVLMACDGRTDINAGLTAREGGELMISKGCTDVYYLDGGGSACLCVNGSKYNRNIDGNGTTVRSAHYTLNVKKETINDATKSAFGKIGEEKQNIIEQIIPLVNSKKSLMAVSETVGSVAISNRAGSCYYTEISPASTPSGGRLVTAQLGAWSSATGMFSMSVTGTGALFTAASSVTVSGATIIWYFEV